MAAAATVEVKCPTFSKRECDHYTHGGHGGKKLQFKTPEDEWKWACGQTKKCSKCNQVKCLTCFKGNTSGSDAFDQTGYRLRRPECSDCTKKAADGKRDAIEIAKRMGMSTKAPPETRCELCHNVGRRGNAICFDHCHERKVFRGWLCNACNRSLGVLGDDIPSLIKAINYLIKTEKQSERPRFAQTEDGILSIL